jgi:hypothetical protein
MANRLFAYQRTNDKGYAPTADEIEAATAKIRATWSEKDHRRRLELPEDDGVEVVIVRDKDLWADQKGRHRAEGA